MTNNIHIFIPTTFERASLSPPERGPLHNGHDGFLDFQVARHSVWKYFLHVPQSSSA